MGGEEGATQTSCGSYRVLCKRLKKHQPPQFPQMQEGACGKSVGRQVKVHKPPGCSQMLTSACRDPKDGFLFKHTCQQPAACAQARERGQREGGFRCARRSRGCERKSKLLPFGLGRDEIYFSPKSRRPGQVGPEEDFCIWKTIWFGGARLWGGLSQFVSSVPFAELPRPGKARNLGRSLPYPS